VLAAEHLDYLAAESAASAILAYAPVQVPDLLHTLEYARSVMAADAGVPEEAEDATVAATLAHQRAALRDRNVDLVVVIGEAALRQEIGSAEVMRAQLRYLAELGSGYPHVTIRVLPFSAGAHAAGGGGEFSILQFSQAPAFGLVHVAGPSGGICLDDPAVVAAYVRTFTQLRLFSLGPDESARKLREVARG
jgi:hypothetical protein